MNNNTLQTAKQSDFVPLSITSDVIREELTELTTVKVKAHEKILDEFLTEIEAVNFR